MAIGVPCSYVALRLVAIGMLVSVLKLKFKFVFTWGQDVNGQQGSRLPCVLGLYRLILCQFVSHHSSSAYTNSFPFSIKSA